MKADRKEVWWEHFLLNKTYWGHGVTKRRLEKIKDIVFDDKTFWDDILLRHQGATLSPGDMYFRSPHTYDHLMGNMSGMVMQTMVENKIIKP